MKNIGTKSAINQNFTFPTFTSCMKIHSFIIIQAKLFLRKLNIFIEVVHTPELLIIIFIKKKKSLTCPPFPGLCPIYTLQKLHLCKFTLSPSIWQFLSLKAASSPKSEAATLKLQDIYIYIYPLQLVIQRFFFFSSSHFTYHYLLKFLSHAIPPPSPIPVPPLTDLQLELCTI